MQRLFFYIIILTSAVLGGVSCSGTNSNATEPANTNTAVESPFASITDAVAALAEGNRLFDENQTEMAIEAYRHAVKLNPDLAEGYFRLGIAWSLLEMQKEQGGEEIAHASNSKDGKTKTNSEKTFEKAVEAYKKWLDKNPKDDVGHYNLGRTYSKLLLDEEAEASFERAVELKPYDTEYLTELGAVRIKLAKYREAIEPLEKAIELDSTNGRAQELLEDAQAGRQRVDYVPKKDANTSNSNKASNSNTNSASNSNTNSGSRPPAANTKPKLEDTRERRANTSVNKPD